MQKPANVLARILQLEPTDYRLPDNRSLPLQAFASEDTTDYRSPDYRSPTPPETGHRFAQADESF